MKRNMGTVDRGIRLTAGAVVAALFFTGQISGTLAIVLGVIAVVFVVTSLAGWCPMYTVLSLSTKKGE